MAMTLYDDHPRLAELAVLHQQRTAADLRILETQGRKRADATREWHDIDDLFVAARRRWTADTSLSKEPPAVS